MVSVVLADDHAVVRQGLRTLLESDPQFTIVGEAADGREAVELVMRRKPTVLVADLMMPEMNGLEVTREIARRKSKTRVVVLSMYPDEAYVLEALRNGASAYVAKESSGAELFHALGEVLAGRRYLSPSISETARNSFASQGTILAKMSGAPDLFLTLTARERTVLRLVVEGATHCDIGDRLKIAPRASKSIKAAIMQKLGVTTRSTLIRAALRRGVLAGRSSTPNGTSPKPRRDNRGGLIKSKKTGALEALNRHRRPR
jgi:DNA-binding NarL/FixJ family response regulator